MENPLDLPVPSDPIERISAMARDLAYGAISKLWSATIFVDYAEDRRYPGYYPTWGSDDLEEIGRKNYEKWKDARPPLDLMVAFGYFESENGSKEVFNLTQKAFALLEKPVIPPSVFISYSRKSSSTFGLLVECRLRSVGINAFIDRSLDPGEEWHSQLQEKLKQCNRFVCIVAKGTLQSPYVCEEIRWAMDLNILTIPVWHPAFDPNEETIANDLRDFVTSRHAIRVLEDSAEAYYNATESLLNRLGY